MEEKFAEIFKGANIERLEADEKKWIPFKEATVTVLENGPKSPVDVIHLHGRSFFDAPKGEFFGTAVKLMQEGKAHHLLIPDSEGERQGEDIPRVSSPGKSLWTDRLVRLGIDKDKIIYSPHPVSGERGFNTLTESQAFLKTMADEGWNSAIVLTQPHQILRAFLGAVRTINNRGLNINLYSAVPESTDWKRKVKGSQGMEKKERDLHIKDEMDRVYTYQEKGDIATFQELNEFLDKQRNSV